MDKKQSFSAKEVLLNYEKKLIQIFKLQMKKELIFPSIPKRKEKRTNFCSRIMIASLF